VSRAVAHNRILAEVAEGETQPARPLNAKYPTRGVSVASRTLALEASRHALIRSVSSFWLTCGNRLIGVIVRSPISSYTPSRTRRRCVRLSSATLTDRGRVGTMVSASSAVAIPWPAPSGFSTRISYLAEPWRIVISKSGQRQNYSAPMGGRRCNRSSIAVNGLSPWCSATTSQKDRAAFGWRPHHPPLYGRRRWAQPSLFSALSVNIAASAEGQL
jgi:hypothetical protein